MKYSMIFLLIFAFHANASAMGFLRKHIPSPVDDIDTSSPVEVNPEAPSSPSIPVEKAPPVLEPIPKVVDEVKVVPVPVVVVPVACIKMNIKYFGNVATLARKAKYDKAQVTFVKVFCSSAYEKKILAHRKKNGSIGFENTSASPAKVLQHMRDGNESLQNVIDNEVDMEVEFYYANNSTVGYTYGNVKRIYVNTKFFDSYRPSSVAANLNHEWLHKLGYKHDSAATAIRPYSTPYGVGSIMRSLGAQFD